MKNQEEVLEEFLKTIGALYDPTRVQLLKFIHMHKAVCVCDLENSFGMLQSRLSRHLKILKEAKFLQVKKEKKWSYYSIKSPLDNFRANLLQEVISLPLNLPPLKKESKSCQLTTRRIMKKVLILCTGNSCRSIIGEAVINKELGVFGIKAFSAGSSPSGRVNPNAKKVLEANGAWDEGYYSKTIEEVEKEGPFDLVVTVCDNAKEACPMFPGAKKQLHLGFEDPDGKPYEAFEETYKLIKEKLVNLVKKELL